MAFREVRSPQQAEITRLGQTSIGCPKNPERSASRWTTPTHASARVPFLQRRITNPTSDQPPAPGPAPHPHPHQQPTYPVRLPVSGLPSGKTQARGLPLLLLEQSATVHSQPSVMSARVRLPVQLLARQPRLQILTHHLIRHTPFRPPALILRGAAHQRLPTPNIEQNQGDKSHTGSAICLAAHSQRVTSE